MVFGSGWELLLLVDDEWRGWGGKGLGVVAVPREVLDRGCIAFLRRFGRHNYFQARPLEERHLLQRSLGRS